MPIIRFVVLVFLLIVLLHTFARAATIDCDNAKAFLAELAATDRASKKKLSTKARALRATWIAEYEKQCS